MQHRVFGAADVYCPSGHASLCVRHTRSASSVGSSLSLRAFLRHGDQVSVLSQVHVGSAFSVRSFTRLGQKLSVHGLLQTGSCQNLSVIQYVHLGRHAARSSSRRGSSTAPPSSEALAACGAPCDAPSAAENATSLRVASALHELPAGVVQLTLADMLTELAEQIATVVRPIWHGDKGRARAVRCIALVLQTETSDAVSMAPV